MGRAGASELLFVDGDQGRVDDVVGADSDGAVQLRTGGPVHDVGGQVELAFTRALEAERLDEVIATRLDDPHDDGAQPVLLVWSDIHTEWVPAPGRHR